MPSERWVGVVLIVAAVACGSGDTSGSSSTSTDASVPPASTASVPFAESFVSPVLPPPVLPGVELPAGLEDLAELVAHGGVVAVVPALDENERPVIQFSRGALTSEPEQELAEEWVTECPYTRGQLEDFFAELDTNEWRDEGSVARAERGASLFSDAFSGYMQACYVFYGVDCLSQGEVVRLEDLLSAYDITSAIFTDTEFTFEGYDWDRPPPELADGGVTVGPAGGVYEICEQLRAERDGE